MFGGVAGFGKRVLDEGVVRLGAFGRVELRLRHDFDVQIGEEAGKFFEFACVAAGEDDFVEHGFSLMGFGLLFAHDLCAGFMADVEGEAADLGELEKWALEQVAALRGEHDGLAGHEKGRGYLKNRFSGSLKPVWHASETENLSGYIPWVGGSVISTWLPICRIFV